MTSCPAILPTDDPCPVPVREGSTHCLLHELEPAIRARAVARETTSTTSSSRKNFSAAPPRQPADALRRTPDDRDNASTAPPSSKLPPPPSYSSPSNGVSRRNDAPTAVPKERRKAPPSSTPPASSPPAREACGAVTKAGTPCRAAPQLQSSRCIFHDPETAGRRLEVSRSGGVASGQSRRPVSFLPINVDLSDRAGIQATVEAVIQLELAGGISPSRSRNVLAALKLASRNFDSPMHRNPVSGEYLPPREIHRHQPRRLGNARGNIAENLIPFVRDASSSGQEQPLPLRKTSASPPREDSRPAS
jgi:hypothetical protein